MIIRLILFLILNFGALALGSYFTGPGVSSDWYQGLNKAPWTPPGWVFGAAWTTIMICFSLYMDTAIKNVSGQRLLIGLFIIQWILNIMWNPVFFYYRQTTLALVVITALTVVVGSFLVFFWPQQKYYSLLVLPYFLWLIIATSLNGYILWNN